MITIPAIVELYNNVLSDLQSEMGVPIPIFGKSFLRVLAAVQAGKLKLYYLAIAKLQKNIFVDTAEPEAIGGTLQRFGHVKLNRNPFPAIAAQYDVTITGVVGSVISAQSTWKSNDDSLNAGKLYILDIAHTMVTTSDLITVRALDGGLQSKLELADEMSATAPIAGVDKTATVATETIEPRAAETIEEYRTKTLDAFRTESQGGAAGDYRLWADDAQGVRTVYPYAKSGATGEVNLFVEALAVDSTDGKGTPSAQLLSDVEEVVEFDPDTTRPLNERGRRPLQVIVNFLPVIIREVNINIAGFIGLDADIQTLITNALTDVTDDVRPFIAGADILENKNDIFSVNLIIATILSACPGSTFGTVTLMVDGTPTASYTFDLGAIPSLSLVTFS